MNMNVLLRKPIHCRFTLIGLTALALVLVSGTMHPLAAQSAPAGAAAAAGSGSPGESNSTEDQNKTAQANAPSQPAAQEPYKLGAYEVRSGFEVGYRMSPGIDGNSQMYRSQVNLFEGIRLFNSYLSLRGTPGTGLFDRMDLSLGSWGDPYNGLRLRVSRMDVYDLRASYRNLNYYNYISTFANPLLAQGSFTAQHTLNVDNRMSDIELRLFPNRKVVPYVGYARNAAAGPGFWMGKNDTTVGMTGDEFLLRTNWQYVSDEYRGGFQFNFTKLNLTLEQGFRHQKNDTGVIDADQPQGNEGTRTYFGKDIVLNSLERSYRGRINLPTSKVLAKYTPLDNLSMTGRYIYSMGTTDSNLFEYRTGNMVSLEDFLAYSTAADTFNGRAKKPNHNGAFLIEYSPWSRLTLTDSVDAFGYHISGAGMFQTLFVGATPLLGPGPAEDVTVNRLLNTETVYNEVRNQAEAAFDIGKGFSVRIGHRYTYVDITTDDSEATANTYNSQNTAIVGLTYRPGSWLRLGVDYENTSTDRALTRTDLYKFDQINLDMRVGPWKGLSFNGRLLLRDNKNTAPDIGLDSHDRNYIAGLSYEPNERLSVGVDYSRTDLFSDILFIIPQNFTTAHSIHNERVHGIGGRMGIGIVGGSKFEMGYRGIINRGTAPIEFHQPYAFFLIPLGGGMAFKPGWQYFGYSDTTFGQQSYKTHQFTLSLVFSR